MQKGFVKLFPLMRKIREYIYFILFIFVLEIVPFAIARFVWI
jgi:hypothetical protein